MFHSPALNTVFLQYLIVTDKHSYQQLEPNQLTFTCFAVNSFEFAVAIQLTKKTANIMYMTVCWANPRAGSCQL